MSDYAVGTAPENLLRGWSRLGFIAVDTAGLYMLVRRSSIRLIWLVLGYACSGIIVGALALRHDPFLPVWKLQLGYSVTLAGLCILLLVRTSRRYVAPMALLAIGFLHVLVDCRSMGAVCIFCACLQLSKVTQIRRWQLISYGATILVLALGAGFLAYAYRSGGAEFASRRLESDHERLAGILIGVREIAHSPFLGHGSWAGYTDAALAAYKASLKRKELLRYKLTKENVSTHSEMLQLWFEGGLLGVAFALCFGVLLVRAMHAFSTEGVASLPAALLVRLFVLTSVWALLLSPLGGGQRLLIALTVAATSIVLRRRVIVVGSSLRSHSGIGQHYHLRLFHRYAIRER